jgi:hypothetical protein
MTQEVGTPPGSRRLALATWAFVALGILLRVARYAMNYPLWWDEAFVAVNFIKRGYLDLLRPLDYAQVCPILFLWAELSVVKLIGFTEWSLRLFPLGCSLASVVLFRHVACRVLREGPALLATAIFAVSYHPIRHAADVKPYASDLFAAVALLAASFEWLRAPERTRWMWMLAAIAPVAIALSHPVVFVAGGIMIGHAHPVWKARRSRVWCAFGTFALSAVVTFLVLYAWFTSAQAAATLATMQVQWKAAFPPLDDPRELARWLLKVHTGSMLAYPCGGENGASSLTLLLLALGTVLFWFRGNRVVLLNLLAPFGLALVAAAVKRYPYGGVADGSPARVMQYLVPSICLLAGLGGAALLALVRDSRRRVRAICAVLVLLASVGFVPVAAESLHPFRSVHAQRARQFARQFWPMITQRAEPVCLRWDLGLGEWNSTSLNVAIYLCNQMIYSPLRRHGGKASWQNLSGERPLRCVLALADPEEPRFAGWLQTMKRSYQLRESRSLVVNMAEPGARPRTENYFIFDFVPRDAEPAPRGDAVQISSSSADRAIKRACETVRSKAVVITGAP